MISKEQIGKRICYIRKKNGFSQSEISDLMNFSNYQKISRIENGKQSFTAEELVEFCKICNASIDILFGEELISTEDFKNISKRYINSVLISEEEKRKVLREIHIEFETKCYDNLNIEKILGGNLYEYN